jgi:hypothetical protein
MKKMYTFSLFCTTLFTPIFAFAADTRTFQAIVADLIIQGSNYVLILLVGLTYWQMILPSLAKTLLVALALFQT